jgi:hypothetical protein
MFTLMHAVLMMKEDVSVPALNIWTGLIAS